MPRGRILPSLILSEIERKELDRISEDSAVGSRIARRARIILACANGINNSAVAKEENVALRTVGRIRSRFLKLRLPGLRDFPKRGDPQSIVH